jgi:cyclophilin family peptidyl-prolyl cis-trans isomerase
MMRSVWMALSLTLIFVCAAGAQQKKSAGGTAPKPAGKPPAQSGAAAEKPGTTAKPVTEADKSEASAEKPSGEAKSDDPAVTEFDKVFGQWKELLAKLQDLRAKYIATPRKGGLRAPIKMEYDELVKQGDTLEPKIIKAAEAAFAAVGNDRPEIGKFLASQLKYYVEHDNYEPAVPIARALIDNQYSNPRAYDYGGLAAYMTEGFDDAATWLKEGDKQNLLGPLSKQSLVHIDQAREKWDEEAAIREKEKQADDLPRVLLKTSQGDITVELFENEAPNTVANFISLIEKKFYDGVTFHRVIPHFMAQGGDPEGTGSGGPGYNIPDETDNPKYRRHFRGSLSMANTGQPNTGGSQFFLCFVPTDHLDGKHTVFGRVIDGIDVLARIKRTEAEPDKQDQNFVAPSPKELDRIVEATVVRKRKHEYVPKKAAEE